MARFNQRIVYADSTVRVGGKFQSAHSLSGFHCQGGGKVQSAHGLSGLHCQGGWQGSISV